MSPDNVEFSDHPTSNVKTIDSISVHFGGDLLKNYPKHFITISIKMHINNCIFVVILYAIALIYISGSQSFFSL